MLTSPKGSSGNTVSLHTENFEPETYTTSLYNAATSGGFSLQGWNSEYLSLSFRLWPLGTAIPLRKLINPIKSNHIYRAMWEFEHQWLYINHMYLFIGGGRVMDCAPLLSDFFNKTLRQRSMRRFPCGLESSFAATIPGVLWNLFSAKLHLSGLLELCCTLTLEFEEINFTRYCCLLNIFHLFPSVSVACGFLNMFVTSVSEYIYIIIYTST